MAVSAYVSASWFLRIMFTFLFCLLIALMSLVFTDSSTFILAKKDKATVSEVLPNPPSGSEDTSPVVVNEPGVLVDGEPMGEMGEMGGEAGMGLGAVGDVPMDETQLGGEPQVDPDLLGAVNEQPVVVQTNYDEGEAVKKLPDALIIGARKAGTRALITFLGIHPQVVTSGDEVQFFNNNESYAKGLEWYKDQLQATKPNQVLIEKTAEYFHVLWVPERVKMMNPDIKILLIVREPFTRMVSDYSFLRRFAAANTVEGYEFPELSHTIEELAMDNTTGEINLNYGGLHRSKYYKFLQNWMLHFPREQIHIINGDKMAKENPAIQLEKVESFLGLDHILTEDKFYRDDEKGFYCIREQGCLGKEKGHKQPEFDPEFVLKIKDFLRPLNKLFYHLAGEDFEWE